MTSNSPENPYGKPVQQAPYSQPATYGTPAPYSQQGYPGAPAVDPGKTMAIIAVILPFVGFGLVGLILGLVAKSKSRTAGFKNTLALVAIIISIVAIIGTIIAGIFVGIYVAEVANQVQACLDGAQTVTVNGQIIDCATVNK